MPIGPSVSRSSKTMDYSKLTEEQRAAMLLIVKAARENSDRDHVMQTWTRGKIPDPVIRSLLRGHLLRAVFVAGPVYQILVWPMEAYDEGTAV